jgi:hypothetical protein
MRQIRVPVKFSSFVDEALAQAACGPVSVSSGSVLAVLAVYTFAVD